MEFKIVFEPGSPITITGPIEDEILCYGLLFKAAMTVMNYHVDKAKTGGIQLARAMP